MLGFGGFEVLMVEGVDGGEVDGHGIELAGMFNEDFVAVVVEGGEAVEIVPDVGVVGVEDVRAVEVAVDACGVVWRGEAIAAEVVAFFDEEDWLSRVVGEAFGDSAAIKSAADDDVFEFI